MKSLHDQHGMTLIELVVVMMIVGILAAVAIPSYRNNIVRSQRSDAKDAVLALATQQEKHYLQCNAYADGHRRGDRLCRRRTAGRRCQQERLVRAGDRLAPTPTLGFTATATAINGENQCAGHRVPHVHGEPGGRPLGARCGRRRQHRRVLALSAGGFPNRSAAAQSRPASAPAGPAGTANPASIHRSPTAASRPPTKTSGSRSRIQGTIPASWHRSLSRLRGRPGCGFRLSPPARKRRLDFGLRRRAQPALSVGDQP